MCSQTILDEVVDLSEECTASHLSSQAPRSRPPNHSSSFVSAAALLQPCSTLSKTAHGLSPAIESCLTQASEINAGMTLPLLVAKRCSLAILWQPKLFVMMCCTHMKKAPYKMLMLWHHRNAMLTV